MGLAQTVTRPRYQQLAIGYPVGTASGVNHQGGFNVDGVASGLGSNLSPIVLTVDNRGTKPLTFGIAQSNDNGAVDAYAVINVTNKGVSVASVTIAPGARVTCTITTLTKPWLKFSVAASQGPVGSAVFAHSIGELSVAYSAG